MTHFRVWVQLPLRLIWILMPFSNFCETRVRLPLIPSLFHKSGDKNISCPRHGLWLTAHHKGGIEPPASLKSFTRFIISRCLDHLTIWLYTSFCLLCFTTKYPSMVSMCIWACTDISLQATPKSPLGKVTFFASRWSQIKKIHCCVPFILKGWIEPLPPWKITIPGLVVTISRRLDHLTIWVCTMTGKAGQVG